jgi:hypothetical protein
LVIALEATRRRSRAGRIGGDRVVDDDDRDPDDRRMTMGQPLTVDIVVFDGVDELDAIGPLEVFRSAGAMGGGVVARLFTREPHRHVTGAYGLRFEADGT